MKTSLLLLILAGCTLDPVFPFPDATASTGDSPTTDLPTTGDTGTTGDDTTTTTTDVDTTTTDATDATDDTSGTTLEDLPPLCVADGADFCDDLAELCDAGIPPAECNVLAFMCDQGQQVHEICLYAQETCVDNGDCSDILAECRCLAIQHHYVPPPKEIGCAHFVEVLGRTDLSLRYVTVDASACDRSAQLHLEHYDFESTWLSADLGHARDCTAYGPSSSAAANYSDHIDAFIGGEDDELAYMLALRVDGVVSDAVWLPSQFAGTEAPVEALRRNKVYKWNLGAGAPDCILEEGW